MATQWDIQVCRWASRAGWRVEVEGEFLMLFTPSGVCEFVTQNRWALIGYLYEACGYAASLGV